MKAYQLITALALGLALSACQGANPFQRQSDPLKDYSSLKDYKTPSDDLNKLRPEISLGADYPVDGIASDKPTTFKVNVLDPRSVDLQDQSDEQKNNLKSALKVVANTALEGDERDGSAGATCTLDGQPSLGGGTWQYKCTFDPGKIGGFDTSATYVFDLTIKSVFSHLDELTPLKVALVVKAKTQGGKQ